MRNAISGWTDSAASYLVHAIGIFFCLVSFPSFSAFPPTSPRRGLIINTLHTSTSTSTASLVLGSFQPPQRSPAFAGDAGEVGRGPGPGEVRSDKRQQRLASLAPIHLLLVTPYGQRLLQTSMEIRGDFINNQNLSGGARQRSSDANSSRSYRKVA